MIGDNLARIGALAESIYDPRLVDIVRRHFQLHPVANGEADKTFPHFARDMGEDNVIVRQADPKHGAGEHGGNQSFQLQLFFEWHADLLAGAPVSGTPAAKLPWLAAGTGELAGPLFASPGFVHSQGASLNFLAVKGVDGGSGRGGVVHRHKREAAGAAGNAIVDECHFRDGAVLFEKILEIVFGRIEGKISYVEFHVFEFWSNSLPATSRSRESGFKSPKSQTQLTIYQAKKQIRLNPMAAIVVHRGQNTSSSSRPFFFTRRAAAADSCSESL